jgi:hypothetical protein
MDTANLRIITDLKKFLMQISSHKELWRSSVVSEKAFTRNRRLPFSTLVLMILNLPKRSLNVELHSFFAHINRIRCGKSAFSMQRTKLKPYFFQLWNKVLVHSFYHHYNERVKRWKGFILLAFDGTVISLPNTPELSAIYGYASNQRGGFGAVARGCIMYDVLNKLIIRCDLFPYSVCERSAVMEQLEQAPSNSLLTFDRGYPCFWLFYLLLQKTQHKFVMRVRLDFNKVVRAFVQSSEQDCIKIFNPSYDAVKQLQQMGVTATEQTTIYLRLVKIPLKSGKIDVLITNFYSSEVCSMQDLKEIYSLRWGVETCLGTLKNQLQIENFSGIRKVCVEQDFFANIFAYNLQSIVEKQCESNVAKVSENRKYNYQINKNMSWAFMKNRLIDLFLTENSLQILLELQALFQQHIEPIRPYRTYPRIRKASNKNGKHHTTTNYKRAI